MPPTLKRCRAAGMVLIVMFWGFVLGLPSSSARAAESTSEPSLDAWMKLLGADDFLQREEATRQIRQLRADAFDALTDAMQSPETEVRARAELLRRELLIRSAEPHDPVSVHKLLSDYADQPAAERATRIGQIHELETPAALAVLCRIVRLEEDEALSKQAAATALDLSLVLEQLSDPPLSGDRFLAILGNSVRPSADWLRLHFRDASSAPEDWKQILITERELLSLGDEHASPEVIDQLTMWLIRLFLHEGRQQQIVPFVTESFGSAMGNTDVLLKISELLLDNQAWLAFDQLQATYEADFRSQYRLSYRYAEGLLKQDRGEEAGEVAQRAFDSIQVQTLQRLEAARDLEGRGMFAWARREFEAFIEQMGIDNRYSIWASYLLSEMLHDQGDELAAAQTLQKIADAIQADGTVAETIDELGMLSAGSLLSRMHYFYAQHFKLQQDSEKQLEHLQQGTAADPTDADLLIARFRYAAADDAFRQQTSQLIRKAADTFREQARMIKQQLPQMQNFGEQIEPQLAQQYNQLAWLISNTEGDYHEALDASKESLALVPNSAGYLDTLARCYFAVGSLDEAIDAQREALRRDPHSGQLRRQLEFFEAQRQEVPIETVGDKPS